MADKTLLAAGGATINDFAAKYKSGTVAAQDVKQSMADFASHGGGRAADFWSQVDTALVSGQKVSQSDAKNWIKQAQTSGDTSSLALGDLADTLTRDQSASLGKSIVSTWQDYSAQHGGTAYDFAQGVGAAAQNQGSLSSANGQAVSASVLSALADPKAAAASGAPDAAQLPQLTQAATAWLKDPKGSALNLADWNSLVTASSQADPSVASQLQGYLSAQAPSYASALKTAQDPSAQAAFGDSPQQSAVRYFPPFAQAMPNLTTNNPPDSIAQSFVSTLSSSDPSKLSSSDFIGTVTQMRLGAQNGLSFDTSLRSVANPQLQSALTNYSVYKNDGDHKSINQDYFTSGKSGDGKTNLAPKLVDGRANINLKAETSWVTNNQDVNEVNEKGGWKFFAGSRTEFKADLDHDQAKYEAKQALHTGSESVK